MRKSLSIVAVLVLALAACYDNPLNVDRAGPFGADLSGTWTLTSLSGTQDLPPGPTLAGPLPVVTSPGSASLPKTELVAAKMVMLYNQEKDWVMTLSFKATTLSSGAVVLTDSVRRGNYFTTTDGTGQTSITMGQNTPAAGYFTGVQPLAGGVSTDLKVITVHSGGYTLPVLPAPPVFSVSITTPLAQASNYVWVWTKQ